MFERIFIPSCDTRSSEEVVLEIFTRAIYPASLLLSLKNIAELNKDGPLLCQIWKREGKTLLGFFLF